jgi:hypothetical protein
MRPRLLLDGRYRNAVEALRLPLGGRGTHSQNSIVSYVAQGLSREITAGRLDEIESAVLSNENLKDITFVSAGADIHSSMMGEPFTTLYRLRP